MSRAERKKVERIYEAAAALLAAKGHAAQYLARVELANAMGALYELSRETVTRG